MSPSLFPELQIYLASTSPRRSELLYQIGVEHTLLSVDVDECWDGIEACPEYVQRLALAKARAGLGVRERPLAVLGGDTCVALDGEILGKAQTLSEAAVMLGRLSGRTHQVYSAVALCDQDAHTRVSFSAVRFRELSAADIDAYCATGEPLGKAGGYAIQGFAATFVSHIEGSYSGVVGLPLFETAQLLQRLVTVPCTR